MRHPGCEECGRLWERFERAVKDYKDAAAVFDAAFHENGGPGEAQQRLQAAEHARLQARQEILTHEKSTHPAEAPSL